MQIPSRFFQVLSSLNKDEFKILGKFLKSPIHNSNKNLMKLYQFLRQIYPDFESEKINLELIHKKVFTGKIFNEKITRNLTYEFCDNIETFFSFINYSNNKFSYQKHLLEELNKRKLDHFVKANLKNADELAANHKIKDNESYSFKAFLEKARFMHEFKEVPMGKSLVLNNIQKEYLKNIFNNFLLILLQEYIDMKDRGTTIKSEMDISHIEPHLKYLNGNIEAYKDETSIYLMFKYLHLNEQTCKEEYFELKNITISSKENISEELFKDFILQLYNFCKIKEREGQKEFGYESFELIKFIDYNNMFCESDGMIIEHNYTNTIATAIRLKEVAWAMEFANKYKNKIPEKVRENTFNYNMAAICYSTSSTCEGNKKKEYENKALDFLTKVKTSDFYYMTRVNNLQLMVYYDKNDLEPIFSLVDAYRHYIHSNELIPDDLRIRYSNFINFISRLANIKSGSGRVSLIYKLKLEVQSATTEYKQWLIKRIEEIELLGVER
jgi:hypothetical protein